MVGYFISESLGHFIAASGEGHGSFAAVSKIKMILKSWQTWFFLGWVVSTSWLMTYITFAVFPDMVSNNNSNPFKHPFFIQYGFTWYFPLYYSLAIIPPGLMILYSMAAVISIQMGATGAAILIAPVVSMMAGWRIYLSQLAANLETFRSDAGLLGSPETAIIGLIGLENLAKKDKELCERVINIVVGYVRTSYAWIEADKDKPLDSRKGEILQAALDLICNVNAQRPDNDKLGIDLHGLDLRKVFLSGDWRAVRLSDSHLEEASLQAIRLEGSYLRGAHLEKTQIFHAFLEGVDLEGAHLEKSRLISVNLGGANLQNATLERSLLYQVQLYGSNLSNVDLTKAILNENSFSCRAEKAENVNANVAAYRDKFLSAAASMAGTGKKYSNLFFEDENAEILWPKGVPSSIKGIKGIDKNDLPPHWRDLET